MLLQESIPDLRRLHAQAPAAVQEGHKLHRRFAYPELVRDGLRYDGHLRAQEATPVRGHRRAGVSGRTLVL